MKARAYLRDYVLKADFYLDKFFEKKRKEATKISPICLQMVDLYHQHLQGGKKARGALMVLGYLLAGGKKNDKIYRASLYPEIIQSFLLIHDDVMDQDLLRRGKPTPEAIYTSWCRKKKFQSDPCHFGLSMAIDLGDLGQFLALEALGQSGFGKEKIFDVLKEASLVYQKVAFGQALDVFGEASGKFNEDYVFLIHLFKTAEYSVSAPLKFGAILAGASKAYLSYLDDYGRSIGIAFQLQDDILGLYGEEKKIGKESGARDIKAGKVTLLIVKALERAKPEEKEFLKKVYGQKKVTDKQVKEIQKIVQKSGALAYSQKQAQKLVRRGKRFIPQITPNLEYQETLSSLADFMIERKK